MYCGFLTSFATHPFVCTLTNCVENLVNLFGVAAFGFSLYFISITCRNYRGIAL